MFSAKSGSFQEIYKEGKIRGRLAFVLLGLLAGDAAAQQAVLWIPARTTGIEEIVNILERNKELRLTAAFTFLPEGYEDRLKNLEKAGRLEIAFRPAGDPPLPLLYYPAMETVKWEGKAAPSAFSGNNRQFLMLRLSRAGATSFKNLNVNTAGLVIAPGGLVADYFPLARSIGVKWLACGPLASTAAEVFEAGGVSAVPFVEFSTAAGSAGDPRFIVFDETSAKMPAMTRALLAAELEAAARKNTLTVSEALTAAISTTASPVEIARMSAPWNGDYTPWASAPLQKAAFAALAKTRSDLMLYLNERGGNYDAAKPAFEEYFAAEDGGGLLALASEDLETRRSAHAAISNAIGKAYRYMKKTPAQWIFSSPGEAAETPESAERLYITSGAKDFEIKNISRKPELPAPLPSLPEKADPYKIWKLDRFKVEVLTDTVVFRFYPLETDNSGQLASGFDHIAIDLYIDINSRPRAGWARPLSGRPFRFSPDSAWEYALGINPEKAILYENTGKGPASAGSFPLKLENGAVTVTVSRSALKGNPLRWGYAALMLAPKGRKSFTIADYIAASISGGYIHAVRPGRK